MTSIVLLFVGLGVVFGVLSASRRHLFSEGVSPQSDDSDAKDELRQRALWVLLCSLLWPLMLMTGLHSWWLLSRRRAQARRHPNEVD